jgi:hypothetical protein
MLFIVIPNLGFEFSRSFLFVVFDFLILCRQRYQMFCRSFSHFFSLSNTYQNPISLSRRVSTQERTRESFTSIYVTTKYI